MRAAVEIAKRLQEVNEDIDSIPNQGIPEFQMIEALERAYLIRDTLTWVLGIEQEDPRDYPDDPIYE